MNGYRSDGGWRARSARVDAGVDRGQGRVGRVALRTGRLRTGCPLYTTYAASAWGRGLVELEHAAAAAVRGRFSSRRVFKQVREAVFGPDHDVSSIGRQRDVAIGISRFEAPKGVAVQKGQLQFLARVTARVRPSSLKAIRHPMPASSSRIVMSLLRSMMVEP